MNQAFFIAVAGIILLAVQSSVMGDVAPSELRPDLTLILVAWSTGWIRFPVGICFSFSYGLCIDLMSGAPLGLMGILYLSIFVFLGYIESYLQVTGVARNYISVFFASFIIFSAVSLARAFLGDTDIYGYQFYWVVMKSLSTATFSWLVFRLLNLTWKEYSKIVGTV
jgi:cell shape-determining protein MreD